MTAAPPPPTHDRFLDGRLEIAQPAHGRHRAGLDAVLLAATVAEAATGTLVDLGAGVGTAGLAAALRAPGIEVVLAERDAAALDLARRNAAETAGGTLGSRVRVVAIDLAAPAREREALLPRESADLVLCNPPFFAPHEVRRSPSAARAAAHVLGDLGFDDWVRIAVATLGPGGRLSLIHKGDGLAEIVAATSGRFGAVTIRPIHPRDGEAAHRLIVTAIKGSRAPIRVLPGLILHPPGSSTYLPEAEAILRGRRGL